MSARPQKHCREMIRWVRDELHATDVVLDAIGSAHLALSFSLPDGRRLRTTVPSSPKNEHSWFREAKGNVRRLAAGVAPTTHAAPGAPVRR